MSKQYYSKKKRVEAQDIIAYVTQENTCAERSTEESFVHDDRHLIPQVEELRDNVAETGLAIQETEETVHVPHQRIEQPITDSLAQWAVDFGITNGAVNALLSILKTKFPELPNDARTLKNTPRSNICTKMGNGTYVHYGLKDGLTDYLLNEKTPEEQVISLDFNIDGLPLAKSSNLQVWPILCNVVATKYIFFVGLYSGNSKPNSSNSFLRKFVTELNELTEIGFPFRNKMYKIEIRAFVCDAPAKAFILNIKGHTGYYSCTKCTQRGTYVGRKVTFPKSDFELRSNLSFRQRINPEYHRSSESLVLETLGINMVDQFVLDYMHVVCLGVMKKLLELWISVRQKKFSLTSAQIDKLSGRILSIKEVIPSEFSRKPRNFDELARWKATEFRQFLLYTGPYILKGIVDERRYIHFLKLVVALRILLDEDDCRVNNVLASELLACFVRDTLHLYGDEYLTHNFHCLTHLHADSYKFGSLENISSFKYENFLQVIKRMVRKGNHTGTQIYNRTVEKSVFMAKKKNTEYPKIRKMQCGSIGRVSYEDMSLSKFAPNNFVLTYNDHVLQIINIYEENARLHFQGKRLLDLQSLFKNPIDSELLHIHIWNGALSEEYTTIVKENIAHKCIYLKTSEEGAYHYVAPLLHTIKD